VARAAVAHLTGELDPGSESGARSAGGVDLVDRVGGGNRAALGEVVAPRRGVAGAAVLDDQAHRAGARGGGGGEDGQPGGRESVRPRLPEADAGLSLAHQTGDTEFAGKEGSEPHGVESPHQHRGKADVELVVRRHVVLGRAVGDGRDQSRRVGHDGVEG
jgi:hypothetical protein